VSTGRTSRRWLWIGLGGLLLLLVLVAATLPAALAWRHLSERVTGLDLAGVQGSIWQGSAREIVVRGQRLGSLQWRLSPWAALSGKPRVELAIEGPDLRLSGTWKALAAGSEFSALSGEIDAGWFAPALDIPALEPTGRITVAEGRLVLDGQGVPNGGDLVLRWLQAGVRGQVQARLGTIVIEARGSEGLITASVSDGGDGDVAIAGQFQLQDLAYRGEVRLNARVSEGPVVEALQWIGMPSGDGGRLLIVEGRLLLNEEQL
jgi:general secretion pathway protein N